MKYPCGCQLDPAGPEDRCDGHREWRCHLADTVWATGTCPPCYRAKLLSVYLDPKATPTRRRE